MARKRFTVEQIINYMREADVFLAEGRTVGEGCRHIGVSEQSYYRWRRGYGGLKMDQAQPLRSPHNRIAPFSNLAGRVALKIGKVN